MHSLLMLLALSPARGSDWGDTGLPWCAETDAPEVSEVEPDDTCYREPEVGTFNPVVEWQWTTNTTSSSFTQVMMTPVVGNLTDDDGDGYIDEGDIPDIAFMTYAYPSYSGAGMLVVISGDGGGTHFTTTTPGGYSLQGSGGIALGDLEGDGSPDICALGGGSTLVCMENDGTFKWAAALADTQYYGYPAIADMDGDGSAEVILGRRIFAADGTVLGTGSYGWGTNYTNTSVVTIADFDADGVLDVVAGNAVYAMDGTTIWYDGGDDGFPAVADFDADGEPEVVRVTNGTIILSDTDGTTLWSISNPAGGAGGPPTVADFDGDGEPEVGIAGSSYYVVLETDGTTLWANAISDYSSNRTGSSVYDFEGDGSAEVVYADELTLWVFDGATGAVELQETDHSSWTLYEYPVIADVDADGETEIVLAGNYYSGDGSGWEGITIIGNDDSVAGAVPWVYCRPVWNQHAYHITNEIGRASCRERV